MGPLAGIKVIDLTSMVSGPVAAMILGDQGADVIKLEPIHGEQMRNLSEPHNGVGGSFYSCNRNKKSLALDLKSEQGKEILWQLIRTADVLIQNFRPGAMKRMGFSDDQIQEENPKLIYVSISGFGENGPYAHQRVYDPIIQALSGATDIQADRDTGEPAMFRIILADKVSALTAAQAISSALFHRERNNEGQHIKLSMLDATIAFFWPEGMKDLTYAEKERDPSKSQTSINLIYETKDGYITAGVISDKEWVGLCKAFNRDDLITDERFATSMARRQHTKERREVTSSEIAKWTTAEILERLDTNDVPSAPLLTRIGLLQHEQILASNTISRDIIEGFGEVRQAMPAAKFQVTKSSLRLPAPKLGEHSLEVLQSLGFDEAQCENLINEKVVVQS
tara:strand:+ start:315 stop:1499 length:1185 start_codon:yes stop_codon:yes gene_type:complete